MTCDQPFSASNFRIAPATLEGNQLIRRYHPVKGLGPTIDDPYFFALINLISQGLVRPLRKLYTLLPDRIAIRLSGIKAACFCAKKYSHDQYPQYSQVPLVLVSANEELLLTQTTTVVFEDPFGRGCALHKP